jgi:hypothetical protein
MAPSQATLLPAARHLKTGTDSIHLKPLEHRNT